MLGPLNFILPGTTRGNNTGNNFYYPVQCLNHLFVKSSLFNIISCHFDIMKIIDSVVKSL